jgi:phospho-N-acetylmuramoyl-pentapeptide-transferase
VLFVTFGYGALGFADDYLKLSRRSHKGVPAGSSCWCRR